MAAPLIRILGPSYSGSTALGYFLNTAPGWCFGSELYRLLPAYIFSRQPPAHARCDHCGDECTVWTPALRAALLARPEAALADVYDLFFEHAAPGAVLVDGSKTLAWYAAKPTPRQEAAHVLSVKHPLRLIASYLYNDAHLIPTEAKATLERCHLHLLRERRQTEAFIGTVCERLRRQYHAMIAYCEGQVLQRCRSDDLVSIRAMLADFGASHGAHFDLEALRTNPCHSIGGNRSLVWQSGDYRSGPGRRGQDGARYDYYKEQGRAGFVQDDKYQLLLGAEFMAPACEAARREGLFELLGYDETL